MDSISTINSRLDKKTTTKITPQCANNRRRFWRLRRKKKLPTVRLGGQQQVNGSRSGSVMVRLVRRIQVKWLKVKKAIVLRKLREYYSILLKSIIENERSFEKNQQLLLMETSLAMPVMGIPLNSFR